MKWFVLFMGMAWAAVGVIGVFLKENVQTMMMVFLAGVIVMIFFELMDLSDRITKLEERSEDSEDKSKVAVNLPPRGY